MKPVECKGRTGAVPDQPLDARPVVALDAYHVDDKAFRQIKRVQASVGTALRDLRSSKVVLK